MPASKLNLDSDQFNPATAKSQDLLSHYQSDLRRGLSEDEAKTRLLRDGRNEVTVSCKSSLTEMIVRQFQSSVVILLLVASVISFCTHDHLQAVGILIAVVINALVGFLTEWRTQVSLEALKEMSGPEAHVVRSGRHCHLPAGELVCGDTVVLEAGSRIPADMRLLEAFALSIDESIMTGESMPATKSGEWIEGEESSTTLAFHGTHVLAGRGRGIVIATGSLSHLGKLQSSLIDQKRLPTPLENKLDELGKQLSILTVVVCVAISLIGLLYKYDPWAMLETGVALAVAAIPEGLPVVATLALAIGTQRMVKASALIRNLAAVETLGCTSVICTDKTGTLTENKLLVTDMFVDGRHFQVSGFGYSPVGTITEKGQEIAQDAVLKKLLTAAALCNDALLERDLEDGNWKVTGDPTEGALLVAAAKIGLNHRDLKSTNPRICEQPFDLVRKKMVTLHDTGTHGRHAYIKGSPERIMDDSDRLYTSDGPIIFNEKMKDEYRKVNALFAEQGLRVLAIATKEVEAEASQEGDLDNCLTFLGFMAMKDLPRQGVNQAVEDCRQAGIRVLMLTGDQAKTATSIAEDLNIVRSDDDGGIIEGSKLESMHEEELKAHLANSRVVARVTPDAKLKIVKTLQADGHVVAMTGDGVNDAPALQQANIGVAMGLTGTDLAKEVSNMVITDDNFSTIVKAIEEGRIIYDNIRRAICYLLTATVASVVTIAVAIIGFGLLVLNPLQLLWLNLIMHVFPGLGIVMQGAAPGIMQRPPRHTSEQLIGKFEQKQILWRAVLVALSVLVAIMWCQFRQESPEITNTVAFATISLALLNQAWQWLFVDETRTAAGENVTINRVMWLMMAVSYALVVVAVYVPGVQLILKTVPLDAVHIGMVCLCVSVTLLSFLAPGRADSRPTS